MTDTKQVMRYGDSRNLGNERFCNALKAKMRLAVMTRNDRESLRQEIARRR